MNTSKKLLTLTTGLALITAPLAWAQTPGEEAPIPPREEAPIPDGVADRISEYRAAQDSLVQERREFAENLRDLSTEERRAAIEEFQQENADRVAAHREFGELIRADMEALDVEVPERPERPERPEQPEVGRPEFVEELQTMMDEFRTAREALLQERREALNDLKDATQEEREAALAALREQQKDTIEAQKELARSIRGQVTDLRENRRN